MKYSAFALPLALLLASTGAFAAPEPIEGQFTVTGTVPTESFSIIDPGNWMSVPQTLPWNELGIGFAGFREQLLMKSTVGPISGYLLEPAQISNGDSVIPLSVSINSVGMALTPRMIVKAEDAASGKLVDFHTSVSSSGIKYVPGDYSGTLSMMFETTAPL
ncbi:CS1 type fimbrial major subunit [Pseudomonas huaxiensis]|uniref:CS1 type fimbrial major subunit n=1 Tax=Pseudomonas huaxiensis TaxID=2213017 RepID=UPI000DA686C5|nr:CS1 type fimbrial major subunit [Pseudomonas huaxiensis]